MAAPAIAVGAGAAASGWRWADGGPTGRGMLLVGTAGDPRVAGFQAARARHGLPPARLIDYRDLVADPDAALAGIDGPATVRIDSPGRDAAVTAGLLGLGIDPSQRQGEHHLGLADIAAHVAEPGRLLPPRQIYRGLAVLLAALAGRAARAGLRLVPDAATILLAFDKSATSRLLAREGVPVPRQLSAITSFDGLLAAMHAAGLTRVFVKLQHGSAAAGAVALAHSRHGMRAVSTVEMVTDGSGAARLYNTRRVRTYTAVADISRLIDALAPLGLHVEAWVPKASVDGLIADVRVLMIDGCPAFRVLRQSRHPMTNLHLGGRRGDAGALIERMPAAAAAALDASCREVARLFPGALQLGLDVAVTTGFSRHYVLEVNAFGDLLKGIARDGLDPYDLQVRAMEQAACPT